MRRATSAACGATSGQPRDQGRRAEADPRRSGEVVDALSPADSRRGDLLTSSVARASACRTTEPSRCGRATASSTCGTQGHALRAGDEGLDVLAFGTRGSTEIGHLPRAGVAWIGGTWTDVGGGDHPWEREVAAGEPEVPELGERPANVVKRLEDVEGDHDGGSWRPLARAAGSELTGLDWAKLPPGAEAGSAHLHSGGRGDVRRTRGHGHARAVANAAARPRRRRLRGAAAPSRLGVSRPASSGIAHSCARVTPGSSSWRTGHGTRTTSVTTRARTRSTSAGSGWSRGSRASTTTTESPIRDGLSGREGKAGTGLKIESTWDSCDCYRGRTFGRIQPPRRRRCRR